MSTAIALISLLVSVGVAIWVHQREHALGKRMLALEEARERDRLRAQGKAVLTARLEEHGQGHRLVIENIGAAEASNVNAKLDGKPIMEHEAMPRGEKEKRLIGSHSQVNYIMAISRGCVPPFELELTWEDASGEPGQYRTTITF
jgi:hypothetical protein